MSNAPGTPLRRVVTGHDQMGRSCIVSDGPPDRVFDDLGQEGLVFHEIWNTPTVPAVISDDDSEPAEVRLNLAPPSGGTRIRILDIPPDAPDLESLDEVFDNVGASEHQAASARHASFHRTETIDYGIVLHGEVTLLMDDGEATVGPGDVVIQRGTNHGWANRSEETCRIVFILVDATYAVGPGPSTAH
jgi:mannose-6-phosphate isomerase-like protein (cupin superfamily)